MPGNTVYLVTGASRGIGQHITKLLLLRPNTTVLPAARSPSAKDAFLALPRDPTSTCIPLLINSASDADVPAAAETIRAHGIDSIDVVIASAGMVTSMETIANTSTKQVLEHVDINCGGVLRLVNGLGGLIGTDGNGDAGVGKKFVVVSSSVGSIGEMEPVPGLAYGISKAAVNFLARKMHDEWKGCVIALHPGWVKTEMGDFAAKSWGAPGAPMEVEDSAEAVLKQVDSISREKHGGKFLSYDGSIIFW